MRKLATKPIFTRLIIYFTKLIDTSIPLLTAILSAEDGSPVSGDFSVVPVAVGGYGS